MTSPNPSSDISSEIVTTIQNLKNSEGKKSTLKDYPIRKMVDQSAQFGAELGTGQLRREV